MLNPYRVWALCLRARLTLEDNITDTANAMSATYTYFEYK